MPSLPDRALLRCLRAEFSKLHGSLALLLCIAAPVFVAVLMALMFIRREGNQPWEIYLLSHAAVWGYFMLPMTVTALTVLLAQMEHGPRTWNHLLALPLPRMHVYLAKLATAMLLCAAMTLALAVLAPALGHVADAVVPAGALTGPSALERFAGVLARMYASAWLLVAVQLWVALRWRSFVPPLVVGIGGTFVAVAASGSDLGPYFPWLIPTNALASEPAAAATALFVGIVGGAACSAAMVMDLRRRAMG